MNVSHRECTSSPGMHIVYTVWVCVRPGVLTAKFGVLIEVKAFLRLLLPD